MSSEEKWAKNKASYEAVKSKDAAEPGRRARRNARRRQYAAGARKRLRKAVDNLLKASGMTSDLPAQKIADIYNANVIHQDFPPWM